MLRYLMLFLGIYLAGAGGIVSVLGVHGLLAMQLSAASIVCNLFFIFTGKR